jgi:hypothetical protein
LSFNRNDNTIVKYSKEAHVEDYGHWIPQDPAGKKREIHRILQESKGNSRKWKQYSDRKFSDFFQWIPVNFPCFPAGTGRKSSEKIRKISGGNTASTFQ